MVWLMATTSLNFQKVEDKNGNADTQNAQT